MIDLFIQVNQIKFHIYKLLCFVLLQLILQALPRNLLPIEGAFSTEFFHPSKTEFHDSKMTMGISVGMNKGVLKY